MPTSVRYNYFAGELVSENRGGVLKGYLPDTQGNVVAMTDTSQTVTDTSDYWPGGQIKSRTGSTPTNLTFVGTQGYYSDTTSRYYVRARNYRADVWRWMTADPIGFKGGDSNLYRYVASNPASLSDTRGLTPHSGCCCCPGAIDFLGPHSYKDFNLQDGQGLLSGWSFDLELTMNLKDPSPPLPPIAADCSFRWFEKTNIPPAWLFDKGMRSNQWFDVVPVGAGVPGLAGWFNRTKIAASCNQSTQAKCYDFPGMRQDKTIKELPYYVQFHWVLEGSNSPQCRCNPSMKEKWESHASTWSTE